MISFVTIRTKIMFLRDTGYPFKLTKEILMMVDLKRLGKS